MTKKGQTGEEGQRKRGSKREQIDWVYICIYVYKSE